MDGLIAEDYHLPRIPEFYNGKSVFITGASGFIGSVLLESLLRCCPGVKSIYILLRSKKNVRPELRKEKIFNKKVFERLKEENQDMLNKVQVISGDLQLPNLGISEEDINILTEEVSIVFHIGANVQFVQPLKYMITNIVLSLNFLIKLCRKMKKFEAFVYTSTAFSNSNRLNMVIKEEVYRLPFRAEKFIHALKTENDEMLHELCSNCKPDWPNTYSFSKCLAENLIMDTASDLPTAIIRPSIVYGTLRNPMPGFLEGHSGMAALSLGAGKGIVKVLHAIPNEKLNFVPVDIVANTHVLAACCIATRRCTFPTIFNCTASENLHVSISEYADTLLQFFKECPLPQSFSEPTKCIIQSNKYLYYIFGIYHHYLPAVVFDAILKISGKKARIYTMYRNIEMVISGIRFFTSTTFNFERNNLEHLNKILHLEDRKNLDLDFEDANFQDMIFKLPEASKFFDWNLDKKCPSERQKVKHRHHVMITCIQWIFIMILCLFVYWIFSLLFR